MTINTQVATSNPPASMSYELCEKWGAPCAFCIHPAPPLSPLESEWWDVDWNDDRHKKREERKKEQWKKEVEKTNKEDSAQKDYYPPSPIYDSNFKEDTMPAPIVKKQDLDPNYYPPNYVPRYGEDVLTLVKNLVAPSTKTKEDNKGEDTKEENKGNL